MLDSRNDTERLEGMKRIVAAISKGRDMEMFYAQVVKNVVSPSIEIRKLVRMNLIVLQLLTNPGVHLPPEIVRITTLAVSKLTVSALRRTQIYSCCPSTPSRKTSQIRRR